MPIKSILPTLFNPEQFININKYVDYVYSIFIKFFNPDKPILFFKNKPVVARNKILNCSNCGNKCNNTFKCDTCPFINKLDIFQHICSDEDSSLKVLPEYKNRSNRTPGIYNKTRIARIAWLKYILENYSNENVIKYYSRQASNREINHYFWLFKEHYILILVEEKNSNNLYIRTCYDIKSDTDYKKHNYHYMQYKNKN